MARRETVLDVIRWGVIIMAANSSPSGRPRELYRDPAHGKIAGICAGIGHYFSWPVWPIRLLLVLLAVFTQFFPLVAAYLIAWFVLDPVSPHRAVGLRGQVDGWVMNTRGKWDQRQTPPTVSVQESQVGPAPASQGGTPTAGDFAATNAPHDGHHYAQPRIVVPADVESLDMAFAELEQQVQALERHVTEPAFVLRQQFRSL